MKQLIEVVAWSVSIVLVALFLFFLLSTSPKGMTVEKQSELNWATHVDHLPECDGGQCISCTNPPRAIVRSYVDREGHNSVMVVCDSDPPDGGLRIVNRDWEAVLP